MQTAVYAHPIFRTDRAIRPLAAQVEANKMPVLLPRRAAPIPAAAARLDAPAKIQAGKALRPAKARFLLANGDAPVAGSFACW